MPPPVSSTRPGTRVIGLAFAVPSGIVPTIPGVLAGRPPTAPVAPRGSAPGWPERRRRSPTSAGSARRRPHPAATKPTTTSSPTAGRVASEPVPAAARRPRGLRRRRGARGLPDPARDGQRQAADLVRQRRDHAEAAGGDRPAGVLLRPRELQHPPRRARTGRAGHRRLRGSPRHGPAVHRRRRRANRSSSSAAPPRRSTWWPTRGAASTSAPATRSSSPISSTTRTSFRGSCFHSGPARCSRSRPVDDAGNLLLERVRESARTEDQAGCGHPGFQRAGHRDAGRRRSSSSDTATAPGADRRRAVDSAHSDRRAGPRRGLLRVLRAQDLRAHRDRRAVRHARRRWRRRRRGRAAAT